MTDDWLTVERLAPHVPDDHSNNDPGCYALVVDLPADREAVEAAWLKWYDSLPEYVDQLVEADRAIYVGATGGVRDRINDHREGKVRQATLPHVFGLVDIYGAWFHDSSEDAFDAEYNRAASIRRAFGTNVYIHQR